MGKQSSHRDLADPKRVIWMATEIAQTPIDVPKSYANATRNHTEQGIARIADSIRQFGFVLPLLLDKGKKIVAGHGRFEAAKLLGMTSVPTVSAEHLSEAESRALRIADNRLAELSDWNRDALQIEFSDLMDLSLAGDLEFDLEITGFEMPEIDLAIVGDGSAEQEAPETVDIPDRSRSPVVRSGDLWIAGEHRLFCGNALDAASYDIVLQGEVVRMVFTDPPYNVSVNGHVRSGNGGAHREFAMASGEMSEMEFRGFLAEFLALQFDRLPDGAVAMVCMDWRHVEELIAVGKSTGFDLMNLCVWNKTNGGMGSLYRSKHELVCVFKKPGAAHINNVALGRHGRNRTNVWDYAGVNSFGKDREADLADHPTVKPTALVADALMDVSHRGGVVLDCFGGSGATLLAAEKTGRRARLIELDPLYCDVALRRWQEMTGCQAVHATTGETWDARAAQVSAAGAEGTSYVEA